ncbi:precorrin-3B synthase [Streptomyces sp. KR80]|uniref:precorrin-3B synthase n=1 Tax=Streptomyces sp. KR80 TaxID=3457426 RepID=UPI003FD69934
MPPSPATSPGRVDPPRREGGDACPGALRLHAADDGALARIRLPAGLLTAHQAELLAGIAEEFGDGRLDITSRGNVQVRGLDSGCGGELARRLRTAGLLPSDRHERARNLIASPLSGLDGSGHADVQEWARRLDEILCSHPDMATLSGRFLFALDDGRGDVAALRADVTLIADADGTALLEAGAAGPALRVPADDAPRAAVLAAEEFLAAAAASGTPAWRVRDLPPGHGLTAGALGQRLRRAGIPVEHAGDADPPPATSPSYRWGCPQRCPQPRGAPSAPGVVQGTDGRCALSVVAPLGRVTAGQWRWLASTAARHGSGDLRVTPWRGVVLPGLTPRAAAEGLQGAADAGFVTDPGSPWHGVGACTGRPGCAKSRTDVRADAVAAMERSPSGQPDLLPVYWSGCERRCGHPGGGSWVDVLAADGGYQITVRGAGKPERTSVARTAPETADAVAAARRTT